MLNSHRLRRFFVGLFGLFSLKNPEAVWIASVDLPILRLRQSFGPQDRAVVGRCQPTADDVWDGVDDDPPGNYI